MGSNTGDQPAIEEAIEQPPHRTNNLQCCSHCQSMTGTAEGLEALSSRQGYIRPNWSDVQDAANKGCALCKVIVEKGFGPAKHEDDINGVRFYAQVPDYDIFVGNWPPPRPIEDIRLHDLMVTRGKMDAFHIALFEFLASDDNPASAIVPLRPSRPSLSIQVAAEIRRLLNECQDRHLNCPRRKIPELPRRVIDVGTKHSPPKLYESIEHEKANYATLSYCWGAGTTQLTTTTSNLREHTECLPSNLSKTILDAIDVCRKIGIPYLWVDALCIVQDDDQDKYDQIDNMGQIYQNSLLTIAAASGERVSDGILFEGKPDAVFAELPLYLGGSRSGTVCVRNTRYREEYVQDPIYRRAWTLQEFLLSPRLLVFESMMPFFKCTGAGRRAIFIHQQHGYDEAVNLPSTVFGVKHSTSRTMTAMAKDLLSLGAPKLPRKDIIRTIGSNLSDVAQNLVHPRMGPFENWAKVVMESTSRNITYSTDRLPALAGIARELAGSLRDEYLAGLWKNTIIMGLCWHRETEAPTPNTQSLASHSQSMNSPSWSWISVPCRISFRSVIKLDAKLVGHTVQLVSPSAPFGQVVSASITLKARILSGGDVNLSSRIENMTTSYAEQEVILDSEALDPISDELKLVYLGSDDFDSCIFLVVEPSTNETYHRVGFACIGDENKALHKQLRSTKKSVLVLA